MFRIFSNPGRFLKSFAKAVFVFLLIVTALASVVWTIFAFVTRAYIMLLFSLLVVPIGGFTLAYLSVIGIYSIGELVENSTLIKKKLYGENDEINPVVSKRNNDVVKSNKTPKVRIPKERKPIVIDYKAVFETSSGFSWFFIVVSIIAVVVDFIAFLSIGGRGCYETSQGLYCYDKVNIMFFNSGSIGAFVCIILAFISLIVSIIVLTKNHFLNQDTTLVGLAVLQLFLLGISFAFIFFSVQAVNLKVPNMFEPLKTFGLVTLIVVSVSNILFLVCRKIRSNAELLMQ